eukprot:gnl/MRDRNA2_/MRDRNA2_101597_c0_seq1.p1 gnl/MRDRNA2_/MRDRNA2_101597_c0~~gnl/MRDRNA2_/MRDRNA2_101597_c0_seq1.p1  ORF type:complete len:1388 (-),score=421.45 gnl/MRDRNA2_/MRDRNA2_101597_c0_seq1:268-4431(-)
MASVDIQALKKLIDNHEVAIDDAEQEIANEPNRKKKKDLEAALKKLQNDEKYVKAKEQVKEAEAQKKKDEERAALEKPKAGAKAKAKAGAKAEAAPKVDAKLDDATIQEIDAAFAATGKDAADAKAKAVASMEALGAIPGATPFLIPRLDQLIACFDHSKLGAPAIKAACAVLSGASPKGHCIATALPALIKGMSDKKWKVKAGCIQAIAPCLQQMSGTTPYHLAEYLPTIVTSLAEAALEVRAEVRTACQLVLKEIGSFVASPEIKDLAADLVTALAEPTNQKHTQGVLARMGNCTFKALIDEASLALLMPIVTRGLKDREAQSKKWSAQIFGSTSLLVKDMNSLKPYLTQIVPLLQKAIGDSVPEVQREGAKAFGILEQIMPEFSRAVTAPWLFKTLREAPHGEQIGAALALAEVAVKMDKDKLKHLIPEIRLGARAEKWEVRRGFLELLDALPNSLKMDFVPYLADLFPPMLLGITGAKDADEDPAIKAAKSLVHRFGGLCPDLLLPAFESCYQALLDDGKNGAVTREKSIALLGQMVDKVLEHKKFGQDLLTTELSSKEFRERLLSLIFLTRSDPDSGVKRVSNGIWKTAGGAPKIQKAIMPTLEKMLLDLRKGENGVAAQKVAVATIEELVKSGDLEAPTDEMPAASKFAFKPPTRPAADVIDLVAGKGASMEEALGQAAAKEGSERIMKVVTEQFAGLKGFDSLPKEGQQYCSIVCSSMVFEGEHKKMNGSNLVEQTVAVLKEALGLLGDAGSAIDPSEVVEKICQAVLGDAFNQQEAAAQDDDVLMKIDDLMLMYGAGHLLLKDTTLICKKNRRYGVVGHNGAGKTTLMKEMVNFRLVGMPQHLKVVHVDDSKLGLMSKSSLSAVEYVIKAANEIGVENAGKTTLKGVGFPEEMFENPVAELSTGWRMRLTLAVAMLKHADIVLLDEPTNHLDEESVGWLAKYLQGLTQSSVIVISHEPRFLNEVCTDIMSYSDKKLVYTEGNFEAFVMAKGIKKEDIEALLSGNLSLDTAKKGEEDGSEDGSEEGKEGGAKRASVSAPVSGPPKISFPIPGSVEGVKSSSRAVVELKNVNFRFGKDKDYLIKNVSGKLCLNSRVAICGKNGCGKSTLMTLLCSELSASEAADGSLGEVTRHCNLRMAYMKQDHLKVLEPYFDTSPLVYISQRFQNGYDEELQKRLIEPEDEEEAERRMKLAKEFGKYGNQVETLIGRSKQGNSVVYEVKWENLDDAKMNTLETVATLRKMGLDKVVIACDERIAAKAAGADQRPLTRREIVKHCEAFGIDEEMCCNRQIRGFSAGQKVRLSLAAMFWTKPHFICVDEPTNYLDVETVDALAKALQGFRGGIVMIEPKTHFMEKICNETWTLENGEVTVAKLNNGVKRGA